MPFLKDEGPPVSRETIEEARSSLPYEYGYRVVSERGRSVILVRVPRAKPDYLHELAEVALYVDLEEARAAKDVVLIGDEKVCRLEPVLLRDHIRERKAEDAQVAEALLRKLDRDYGYTVVDHRHNMSQHSLAVRIPRASVAEITAEDVQNVRRVLQPVFKTRLGETQAGYLVADGDFERLGRRLFLELVDPDAAKRLHEKPAGLASGVLLDHGSAPPPVSPQPAALPPPGVVKQVFTAPPARPRAPSMPSDPTARTFVERALAAEPRTETPNEPASPPPPPEPARTSVPVQQTDEFEVFVSKPRSETAPPHAAAPPPPPAGRPQAPEPRPEPAGFVQTVHNDEYEVFVSKRKDPDAAAVQRPRDDVTDIVQKAANPPKVGPAQDSGGPFVVGIRPKPEPAAPGAEALDGLAGQLQHAGYKVVRDLEVEGTTFQLAAHRESGKKVLAKTLGRATPADVRTLASVADRLGADVCLVVADDVTEGARLAAWGTRVELMEPHEAENMAL